MITVAVISPGAMGASVGKRLVENGCKVLTDLDGRSAATRNRAIEAGMQDASIKEIAENASFVLSIMPPSEAHSFAVKFRKVAADSSLCSSLVFADCNAVNPTTVRSIASVFDGVVPFVDGAIIGGPITGNYGPTFYASADDDRVLDRFTTLSEFGLKVSPLTGEGAGIGDASALKMSYAGITKGITGLFTTMILAANASSPATAEALRRELSLSQPELLSRITRVMRPMFPKAYRWVGEMEEIAEFVGGKEGQIYKGISEIYARIERDQESGNGKDVKVLDEFVAKA